MDTNSLKYSEKIKTIIEEGIPCPPQNTFEPNGRAYRYVFKKETSKNHVPQLIKNPKRKLDKEKKCSGYALSCFEEKQKAIKFYKELSKNIKNINKTLGDSIASGVLDKNDGLRTYSDEKTHFDLYEYKECNLSLKFEKEIELI